MKTIQKNFIEKTGQRIMDLRVLNHLSREYLAEQAEISSKYLYEIERGRKGCSAYILYRLAEALNVSIDYLLSDNSALEEYQELIRSLKLLGDKQGKDIPKLLKVIYEISQF